MFMRKPLDDSSVCAACKGRGWFFLLVSRVPCEECKGSGSKLKKEDSEEFEDAGTTGTWRAGDSCD